MGGFQFLADASEIVDGPDLAATAGITSFLLGGVGGLSPVMEGLR